MTARKSSLELFKPDAPFLTSANSKYIVLLLGILFVCYAVLTLNGYGNHDDIYRMIGTWRTLIQEYRYVPSRFQGNLVPEMIIGFTSQIGSFYLSNLTSTILAISSLYIFYRLLIKVTDLLTALVATAAVGANPFWIIPSVTSTDYIYPVFFFLVGLWFLIADRFRWAAILFALAVSSRLTYGPIGAIAFLFYFPYLRQKPELRGRFLQGIVLFLLGVATLYLPVFFASGMTLSFFGFASDTSGGKLGDVVRFLYKSVYLWGLPTFLVLLGFFVWERKFYWQNLRSNPFYNTNHFKLVFHAVFWCFLYSELLFAKLPHQYQYLIPVLFSIVYLIAISPDLTKRIVCLSLIFLLHVSYAFINFDVIDTYQTQGINHTIHSDRAEPRFSIKEGVLLRDYRWRSTYQKRMVKDFNQTWADYGRPLENPQ